MSLRRHSTIVAVASVIAAPVFGDVAFQDDFTGGASVLWQNVAGQWTAESGLYWATAPNNFPNAHAALPFEMSNLDIQVEITGISDGGIWLRSAEAPGTPIGVTGVLLVTLGSSMYWHVVTNPATYGGSLNPVSGVLPPGGQARVRVVVCGDTYEAYVNDSPTPATTLVTGAFGIGRVALYANTTQQRFDGVTLTSVDVGDLNFDGTVDGADLGLILANWGPCGSPCDFDLTCDGLVDGADLGILLSNWG